MLYEVAHPTKLPPRQIRQRGGWGAGGGGWGIAKISAKLPNGIFPPAARPYFPPAVRTSRVPAAPPTSRSYLHFKKIAQSPRSCPIITNNIE